MKNFPKIINLKFTRDKRGTFSKILSSKINNELLKSDQIKEINISTNKKRNSQGTTLSNW